MPRPGRARGGRTRLQYRWNQIATSPYPWEQEGLDHIKRLMPDAEPFRAWATFSFTARSGRINECDLLIAVPAGLYLVELKAHPGRVVNRGDTWTFSEQGGRMRTIRNPLHLTDLKSKELRGRLEWAVDRLGLRGKLPPLPRIQPVVFLSAAGLDAHLDEVQATEVYARDDASTGLSTIWRDLLSRPPQRDSLRVTPEISKRLGDLLTEVGVAASMAHLRFGDDWTMLPEVLDSGPTWEDRLAERKGLVEEQGRVRIYLSARNAAEEEQRSVERAARREYQVLQGITHPGIAQALDFRSHQGGPAILFRHRASDLRLDSYLDVHAERLTPTVRLDLVRQLAEAVRYAHSRSLYHRAIAARSVYVSARPDGSSPVLRIIDWQSAARDPDATYATVSPSPIPGRHTADAEVYLAPEVQEPYADPGDLDVFGLGAVAYLILTGQPPATNRPALQGRLAAEGGLRLFAASDSVSPELDDLIFSATRADVNDRLESAEAFLLFLEEPERQTGAATLPTVGVNPLTALPGDELPGGWLVERVLGTGSTARVLLVDGLDERDDGVQVRGRRVLKVALDDVKAQRLYAEAEALKKVGGGAIIRRYEGPFQLGDHTVLDLEYAGERSLGAHLRAEGRLSYHDLERFGGDLFAALRELAAHGVRHRDIKPDNLGIQIRPDRSRQLKLFDFSLADIPDRETTVGTHGYLDPLIGSARRPAFDDQAEWYAAAVTLYEMASGTRLEWATGGESVQVSDVELPQIAADLFEPGLREGLTTFFRRALHREVDHRFDTLDQLEASWRSVFTTADAGLPASTPATADLDTAGTASDVAAVDAARDEHARAASLTTPLDAAGLSPRAVSVAHGLGAGTVGELLDIPQYQIARARGTGSRVRKELIRRHKQWGVLRQQAEAASLEAGNGTRETTGPPVRSGRTGRRPGSDEAAGTEPAGDTPVVAFEVDATWVPSVDELAALLTSPPTARRSRRREIARAMLGLGSLDGWPTQADVGNALRLTQGTVSRSFKETLASWATRPELRTLRDDLVAFVIEHGRVMTVGELATAVRSRRGCRADSPAEESALAGAVVRAALEVEERTASLTDLGSGDTGGQPGDDTPDVVTDARLMTLRRTGTVWVAAESLAGTNDPTPAELVEYALKLGAEAHRLAVQDPLPGRAAVVRTLREQKPPAGLDPLPDTRLVELAAAAADPPAAVSSRLELYPRDLSLERALRISQAPAGVTYLRGVTVEELLARLRSRFPQIELPESLTWVPVEEALRSAGFDLRYDTQQATFLPPERPIAPSSLTATTAGQGEHPTLSTLDGVPALAKLAAAVERGGFVAITVRGKRLGTATEDLIRRYPVAGLDLDAVFLKELRALVSERGQDWAKVLAGDIRFQTAKQAAPGFGSFLQAAWGRVARQVMQSHRPGQVLFVNDATLLGRYWNDGGHDLLVALQASARRPDEGPHGVWLLCPGDTERDTPRLGQHIVEVLGDHELAILDRSTVERLATHAA